MKKFLLTLTIMISVMALSAQKYTVTERETGNAVESGATYFICGDGSASWGEPGGELFIEFTITATDSVNLIAEKVENNVIEGTSNFICFGQCLSSFTYVSDPVEINPGDLPEVFSMHYMADDYIVVAGQEQSMTYYLYEANNPNDKFVINVIFKYSLDDVEENGLVESFSNAYPVPANDVVNFDYSFNSSVNAEIAIFNMMGQEVLRSSIGNMSGRLSLNVSDLTDGVYFYSLIVNGKTERSNKLVVRR